MACIYEYILPNIQSSTMITASTTTTLT